MQYFERRLWETVLSFLIPSIVCALLFSFVLDSNDVRLGVFVMGVCLALCCGLFIFFSAIFYRYSDVSLTEYYKTNIKALLFVTLPCIILAFVGLWKNIEPLYTFLFFPFKFLWHFLRAMEIFAATPFSKLLSAVFISIFFFAVSLIIPVFAKKLPVMEEEIPQMLVIPDENTQEDQQYIV